MRYFYEIKIVVSEQDDCLFPGFYRRWIGEFAQDNLADCYDLKIVSAELTHLEGNPALGKLHKLLDEMGINNSAHRIAIANLFGEASE